MSNLHPIFQNIVDGVIAPHGAKDVSQDQPVAADAPSTKGAVGFTPLTLHEWSGLKPNEVGKYWEIRGGKDVSVDYGTMSMWGFNLSGWMPKEAAEFIVRAGNSHQPLIDALTLALAALDEAEAILGGEYGDHHGALCEQMIALKDKSAAALKLARGE